MTPLVEELSPVPTIEVALDTFADWPDLILFDSALRRDTLGRYSFLSADPLRTVMLDEAEYGLDPFSEAREMLESLPQNKLPDLPPFQGGVAGMLSYELGGCFERLPLAEWDEFQMPVLHGGLYDWVLAWDHHKGQAWVICQQLAAGGDSRTRRDSVLSKLAKPSESDSGSLRPTGGCAGCGSNTEKLAKQFGLPERPGVTSDFSHGDYLKSVQRVRDYIYAGDIFQANLSQRLLIPTEETPLEIYKRLRACNPAPFAGFYQHDDWAIASASPERFIKVQDRVVTTRPIKGTRQRRAGAEADLFTKDELRQSEKDVAENVMIVDLLRNDLSRVCDPGTVSVPQLCSVESYETVQHLVSEVRGELPASNDTGDRGAIWELLKATFPGGSITGAPKVRAMEIIAELEPTARGPYCGSLFYAGFDGSFDSSILIRTLVCRNGYAQCSAGGGIVAQSDPASEYQETLDKAEGMLRAFGL